MLLKTTSKTSLEDENNAEIAQLVEHNLAKVGVAGPSPVFRSNIRKPLFQRLLLFMHVSFF